MKSSVGLARVSARSHLLHLFDRDFPDSHRAHDLFDEFLQRPDYDRTLCRKLLAVARDRIQASWHLRRLAVLMLEHQILKLDPNDLAEFDFLFDQLNLKQSPGHLYPIVRSVLKEGYSTTDLRSFILEFRRKLERLSYVHDMIRGRRTTAAAAGDFIMASRRDCRLSLARYLFTPEEVVAEILRQLRVTQGVQDMDSSRPGKVEENITRAIECLPDFEGAILRMICETSNVYWVSEATSSEINSLVEQPLTSVVLVIKPPGSEIEFEIKRAGRRGRNPLSVVYAREGSQVPPTHRLDGGSMLSLLRFEANAASRFAGIYRLVHGTEAPVPRYVSRTTISSVPTRETEAQTILFFTEPQLFGKGFGQMRIAMKESVNAFRAEGNELLPVLPGDLGLTVQFLGHVAPAQAIVCGTTSFRLDKLALYLSDKGPDAYFKEGLGVAYTSQDEKRLADELLSEVLGPYHPPKISYRTYEQYLRAAFRVEENRNRADQIYSSLLLQIAKVWGTMLALRVHSRGESCVARNVGLKSFWYKGQWRVKIIFMDHDALMMPGPGDEKFYARGGVPNMAFDESYIWGKASPEQFARSAVGCLQRIYRIENDVESEALARDAMKEAYRKTQHELLTSQSLRSVFNEAFLNRILDWDRLVAGYFRLNGKKAAARRWKKEMEEMLAAKGYGKGAFEANIQTIEENRAFLERYLFLFTQ